MGNFFVYSYYGLIIGSFFLFLVVIALAVSRRRMARKYRFLAQKQESVIWRAESEADNTLKEARREAREIISSSIKLSEKEKADMAELVKKSINKISNDFSESMKASLSEEIRGFGENLLAEVRSARGVAESEVGEYKKEMIANLDKKVDGVVRAAIEQALPEVMDLPTQERLVVRALGAAKEKFETK